MYKRSATKKMTRSENMSHIRSKNTSIEILLRKSLWSKGIRYRVNDKSVFGKPDIVFKSKKIAVFCDSEFWHGKNYLEGKSKIKTNTEYWNSKLKRNIQRDKEVNQVLKEQGWVVLRFWSDDILKRTDKCVNQIEKILKSTNL